MDNNDSFNKFGNFKKLNFGEDFEPPAGAEIGKFDMEFSSKLNSEKEVYKDEVAPEISDINQGGSTKDTPKKGKKFELKKPLDNTREKMDSKRAERLRFIIYSFVLVICLFLLFNQQIFNIFYITNANSAYARGDYNRAFQNFKSAFATKVDNSKNVEKYFSTMEKLELFPVVQKEMIMLKKVYNDESINMKIEELFDKKREIIRANAGVNYVDNAPTNSNIIHWNPSVPIVIRINQGDVPDYYVSQIKNAFNDWSNALDGELLFDYDNNKKPNIDISFVDSISGASNQYGNRIEILGSTEPVYTGKNLIKTLIKFKKTDVDNSIFTENQIYNLSLHEIGHALGISGHSFSKEDVMYPTNNDATWSGLSQTLFISKKYLTESDKNTIKLFYRIIPNITNVHYFNSYKKDFYYPDLVLGESAKIAAQKLREAQSYMKLISGNYISYMDLGEGYFSTKNYDEAKAAFLEALKLAKEKLEFYNAYYNLAVTSYEAGKYEDAINYASVANTYTDDRRASEVIGFSYIKLKEFDKAESEFRELVENNPENLLFSYTLTDIYFSRYKFFDGIGEMKRIKSINPDALKDDVYAGYRIFGLFL